MSTKGITISAKQGAYAENTPYQMESDIRVGKTSITEAKLLQLYEMLEFVERLVAEDPKAAAIMAAVKAKRRIL
jgi:hypothetical protein